MALYKVQTGNGTNFMILIKKLTVVQGIPRAITVSKENKGALDGIETLDMG